MWIRDRHSLVNADIACFWWTPGICDFKPLENSTFSDLGRCNNPQLRQIDDYGVLLKTRITDLSLYCDSTTRVRINSAAMVMHRASLSLRFLPSTQAEMIVAVAYAQRTYLDALALADYIEHGLEAMMRSSSAFVRAPLRHVLGASLSDPAVVNQLQRAGIPAYWVVPHQEAFALGATAFEPLKIRVYLMMIIMKYGALTI